METGSPDADSQPAQNEGQRNEFGLWQMRWVGLTGKHLEERSQVRSGGSWGLTRGHEVNIIETLGVGN